MKPFLSPLLFSHKCFTIEPSLMLRLGLGDIENDTIVTKHLVIIGIFY